MSDAATARPRPARTLIGGVGYTHLRDFSVGPVLVERLERETWPDGIRVEDLSYNPVAVLQRLETAEPPFVRLVTVAAVRRGRPPGSVTAYRWNGVLPDTEEVQARVAEAVTGVISLDNLLIVSAALGGLPPEVFVVEVEPELEAMGDELTPSVRRAATRAAEMVRALADAREPHLPTTGLGGFGGANGGEDG